MARDHARLRLDIWADPDWRALPAPSQWLYIYLLSSPGLNYAGVADWRPRRIAKFSATSEADNIERAALALERPYNETQPFVIIDRDSEEALIRTFIRHDKIMTVPNVGIACVKAWQDVASEALREVIAWEIQNLYADQPELPAFQQSASSWGWLEEVLDYSVCTPSDAVAQLDPNPFTEGPAKPLRGVK